MIDCSKCENYFHKKCISHDSIKPDEWKCHYCHSQCQICQFEASNDEALNHHMLNNHSPDFSVQCEICDKRFNYEYNLHSHMISHLQELPQSLIEESIKCKRCDKTFSSEADLKAHNTEHSRFDALDININ